MSGNESADMADAGSGIQEDLRRQISALVHDHLDIITTDTVAIFPFSGDDTLDTGYCRRVGLILTRLLAVAIRDGRLDARDGFVPDLRHAVLERGLSMERLFTFAYLIERTTLDELALDDRIGATSEPWPVVAQLVRRASFDLLAAYTQRAQLEPSEAAITDKLTTLHTRLILDAVLAKEAERAGRFGYEISLILFDVDHLSAINQEHGYGVGDKILERLGILIRQYFRQHDWVVRYNEDSMAVLLSRTPAEDASELAERVRSTVEERMGFTDHRTERAVTVTLSAAVINIKVGIGDTIDPERLLADAEAAVERAKQQGRNRVVRVDGYSGVRRSDPAP
jgi:diguanylate cyclase (GGDEF)-like protein